MKAGDWLSVIPGGPRDDAIQPTKTSPAQHRKRVAREAVARRRRRVATLHASWPGELSRTLPVLKD